MPQPRAASFAVYSGKKKPFFSNALSSDCNENLLHVMIHYFQIPLLNALSGETQSDLAHLHIPGAWHNVWPIAGISTLLEI